MNANKKWLIRFFSVLLALCLLFVGVVVAVDPFCYYRLTDLPYFANVFFFSPGMIKHREYETALLGSSMALHFDQSILDEALQTRTLKICENGMKVTELNELLTACRAANHAKRYLICVDMDSFRFTTPEESRYPTYLLNKTILDDFKYWFNFDAWTKYMPLDAASIITKRSGSVTGYYDEIGLMKSTEGYNEKAALEQVLANRPAERIDKQQRTALEAMIPNFDALFNDCLTKFDSDTQIILFLPPMSVGRWYLTSVNDSTDYYYQFRQHIAEVVSQHENITLYDFQSCDFTNDLSLYKDQVHYNYTINDFMAREFAKPDYIATPETVAKANAQIAENVRLFAQKYGEALK